ncbi:MAG: hypothetical protein ACREQR_15920 [Candidatus Binataceae bacterium]
MKNDAGKIGLRGLLRAAAILIVLFAAGALGAIVFTQIRAQSVPADLAQSPMVAAKSEPSAPAAASSPAANVLAANPMSGVQVPPMQSAPPIATVKPTGQPPPVNGNELSIPRQAPPASSALTLPARSMLDSARSRGATSYLQSHRLPFVTAQVYRDASGAPAYLMLSGKVATEFGKQDAGTKARKFLNAPNLALENQIQIDPGVQAAAKPMPNQGGELKLPGVFKGCWELVSDRQASPVRLLPGAREGCVYTQDSGRFCYQRTASGDFEPTFSSLRLKPGMYGNQADQWSRVELVSTDGVDSMRMRFLLHHSDSPGGIPFLSANNAIDETHSLSCRVTGDTMRCQDDEVGHMYGSPWCEAMHSDEFRRVVD